MTCLLFVAVYKHIEQAVDLHGSYKVTNRWVDDAQYTQYRLSASSLLRGAAIFNVSTQGSCAHVSSIHGLKKLCFIQSTTMYSAVVSLSTKYEMYQHVPSHTEIHPPRHLFLLISFPFPQKNKKTSGKKSSPLGECTRVVKKMNIWTSGFAPRVPVQHGHTRRDKNTHTLPCPCPCPCPCPHFHFAPS